MMSRISYFKLVKNSMKRRIWYGSLLLFLFFLIFPLNVMLECGNLEDLLKNYTDPNEQALVIERFRISFQCLVGGGDFLIALAVAAAALLGAWSGLCWLHSKKKMDLVGSLPIRREKRFLIDLVTTVLLFLIAYILNLLFAVFIGIGKGLLTGSDWIIILQGLGLHLMYFLIFYFCAALAMILTGKILVGVLATGVLLTIGSILFGIVVVYARTFFQTYVESGFFAETVIDYFSPVGNFINVTSELEWQQSMGRSGEIGRFLITGLFMGIGFAVLDIWLISIRPAEAAEQSIAFPKIEGIVKACILCPVGLGGGLFFYTLAEFNGNDGAQKNGWLWFGILFSVIVGSIVIEIIYHLDRKRIINHNIWTLSGIGVVFLTAGTFVFDWFGYDQWLPNPEEIAHAVVCTQEEYYSYHNYAGSQTGSQQVGDYLKEHIEEFQGELVYSVAQSGVNHIVAKKENGELPDGYWNNVVVIVQLNDGSVVSRSYMVQDQEFLAAKQAMYAEESYKKAMFPILSIDPNDFQAVELTQLGQTLSLRHLQAQEMQQIMTVYQQELRQLDYMQAYQMDNSLIQIEKEGSEISESYPFNNNFTQTMALLKANGISADLTLQQVPIQEIAIQNLGYLPEKESKPEASIVQNAKDDIAVTTGSEQIIVNDPSSIEILKQNLVYRGEDGRNTIDFEPFQLDLEVAVRYLTEEGEVVSCSAYYKKGMVPELVNQLLAQ